MVTKQYKNERSASILTPDLSLVYKPPRSATRRFFWRWRILFESTFALTMFEGWEKILIVSLMAIFWGLLITGIVRYLPYHLQFLYRRTIYYLSGTEQKEWSSIGGIGAAMLSSKSSHMAEL
ncbi:hypothetical protein BGY98DRAFT_920087 [Russula aff. rugulosa BPL654]|nr:hypothetical protein BGY98DRAFT_920087 [Russula aff. rugulosa BPL654]